MTDIVCRIPEYEQPAVCRQSLNCGCRAKPPIFAKCRIGISLSLLPPTKRRCNIREQAAFQFAPILQQLFCRVVRLYDSFIRICHQYAQAALGQHLHCFSVIHLLLLSSHICRPASSHPAAALKVWPHASSIFFLSIIKYPIHKANHFIKKLHNSHLFPNPTPILVFWRAI